MAKFGAMFMFVRPFSECNELTLINMFKMTVDLLLKANSQQLDFDSLVFADKSAVAQLDYPQMLKNLLNARVLQGRVVHDFGVTGEGNQEEKGPEDDRVFQSMSPMSPMSPMTPKSDSESQPESPGTQSGKKRAPMERTDTFGYGDVLID